MKCSKTRIEGVLIIEPDVFGDNRGWFYEVYNQEKYKEIGIDCTFVQDNHSYSSSKGIIRGIHFQKEPFSQAKLVRCVRGKIIDVIVDLRKSSSTYMQWIKVELSGENKLEVFIPHGCGHAFITIEDDCEINYKVDKEYNKESDRSILWNDEDLAIDWGIVNPILSEKDKNAPTLKNSDVDFQ